MMIDTTCGRMSVDVAGDGPDVLLWPSLLCDGSMWRYQLPALSARHRVISVDPPGHGRSEPVPRAYTLDDCVTAALTIMDALGVARTTWCGLSWGGMVGMRVAARFPERVNALVLADCSARVAPALDRLKYGLLAGIARRYGVSDLLARVVMRIMFHAPSAHPEAVSQAVAVAKRLDRASLGRAVDAVLLHRNDVSDAVRRIAVPTLVVVGEHDRATPVAESEHIARLVPRSHFLKLPHAGHLSALEAPDRFTAELVRFLGSLPATRGAATSV